MSAAEILSGQYPDLVFDYGAGGSSGRFVEGDGGSPLSTFGDISSYDICAGCGQFHSAFQGGETNPLGGLNADDRGTFGPNGKPSLSTGDAGVNLARGNLNWLAGGALGQPLNITYAFRATAPATMPQETTGFSRFTDLQINATLVALSSWSDVANITFQRATGAVGEEAYSDNATILFGNYSSGAAGSAAFAFLPGNRAANSISGDVWVNNSQNYNATPVQQGYGQLVLVHEIGHALGLRHPGDYNASENAGPTYSADATYFEDSLQFTVMSYFSERNTGGNFGTQRYASAPLLDDISAIQRLYGANQTTRTGDTIYGFNSNAGQAWFGATSSATALIFAVWDAGGVDTFDFSGYAQSQIIDLRQGAFSNVGGLTGNVSIALGAVIENAIGGAGADRLIGNAGDNVLNGGLGNDIIDGGLGSDTVVFSGNRANYTITWNGQVGTVVGADGTDTVTNVEFLRFADQTVAAAPTGGLVVGGDITANTINGTAFADILGGGGGDDVLTGLAGNDTLDGGSGNDRLSGGDGNDVLIGGAGNDTIDGGAGSDIADYGGAQGGVSVSLAAGTAIGAAGSDTLTSIEEVRGSAFNDVLTGDALGNILRGGGGVDVLNGGGGNDLLFAGAPGTAGGAPDVVKARETANATIGTAINIDGGFDLQARTGVENATTIPHATILGTAHGGLEYYAFTVRAGDTVRFDIDSASFDAALRLFQANGNEIAQNDDPATADSDGSGAQDSVLNYTFTTAGTYYIQVSRYLEGGTGISFPSGPILAGGTYQLNISIPSAATVPTIFAGSTLNGEAGDDSLTGGTGSDTLNGGSGNDTLDGGTGVDVAVFSGNFADYAITTASDGATTIVGLDGRDTLRNIEQLQFADRSVVVGGGSLGVTRIGSSAADTMVGTEFNDSLSGEGGNDTISGLGGDDSLSGGSGSDTIDGGAGIDTLVLTGAPTLYQFERTATGWLVRDGLVDVDIVSNIERVSFQGQASMTITEAANRSFDAYRYMASYPDLLAAFRDAPVSAYRHYVTSGIAEGRSPTLFNTPLYLASNPDLIQVFGPDLQAASQHYIRSGINEGRSTNSFDGRLYAASNADVARASGGNVEAAALHYVEVGFAAGRPTNTFNGLIYAASNPDVAAFYGSNAAAAMDHYLQFGAREGRLTNTFDARIYAATNIDLAQFFGTNTQGALNHYLTTGVREGRITSGFDAVAYLLTNPDLGGMTPSQALDHWLAFGAREGRLGDSLYGREQGVFHQVSGFAISTIDRNGDLDWFQTSLTAGQRVTIDLLGAGSGIGTLGDGVVRVHDALGRLVATADGGGTGADARLSFTPTTSGTYYLVVVGANGTTGTYRLAVTPTSSAATDAVGVETIVGKDEALVLPGEADGNALFAADDALIDGLGAKDGPLILPIDPDGFLFKTERDQAWVVPVVAGDEEGPLVLPADPDAFLFKSVGDHPLVLPDINDGDDLDVVVLATPEIDDNDMWQLLDPTLDHPGQWQPDHDRGWLN